MCSTLQESLSLTRLSCTRSVRRNGSNLELRHFGWGCRNKDDPDWLGKALYNILTGNIGSVYEDDIVASYRNDVLTCSDGLAANGAGELNGWMTITSLVTVNDDDVFQFLRCHTAQATTLSFKKNAGLTLVALTVWWYYFHSISGPGLS